MTGAATGISFRAKIVFSSLQPYMKKAEADKKRYTDEMAAYEVEED